MIAPWNASWSCEDAYEIRPCRWAEGKLAIWSPYKPGEGRPVFAKPKEYARGYYEALTSGLPGALEHWLDETLGYGQ